MITLSESQPRALCLAAVREIVKFQIYLGNVGCSETIARKVNVIGENFSYQNVDIRTITEVEFNFHDCRMPLSTKKPEPSERTQLESILLRHPLEFTK